jgi:hypothetical protein
MKTDVFKFSKLGMGKLKEISENQGTFTDFLKFQGRIYKHRTNVALEFFAQRPEAKFIADEKQWQQSGYTVSEGSEAIRFVDEHGNQRDLFDFSQIEEENEPSIWTITKENANQVKFDLGLTSDKKLINGLVESTVTAQQITSCMETLNIPLQKFEDFRRSFVSAVQTVIAGRLEVGGNTFSVKPDLSVMKLLKTDFARMDFLTLATDAARKPLSQIEQIMALQNAKKLNERNDNHDLHSMGKSDSAGAGTSAGVGVTVDSAGGTSRADTFSTDDSQGRSAILGTADTGQSGRENVSRVQGKGTVGAEDIVQIRPNLGSLSHESDGIGAVSGGRATGDLRGEVGDLDAGGAPDFDGTNEVATQIYNGGTGSGREGVGVSLPFG